MNPKTETAQKSLYELEILIALAERSVMAMEVRHPNLHSGDRQLKAIALTKSLCTSYGIEPPPLAVEVCCEAALLSLPTTETIDVDAGSQQSPRFPDWLPKDNY